MTQPTTLDTSHCPVCGLSNSCTLANPATATQPCWCFAAKISNEVLAQLPEALRNQSCLCPGCAQGLQEQAQSDTKPREKSGAD